ncbi:MAG: MFS transporter [Pseudomonadota bacterium]
MNQEGHFKIAYRWWILIVTFYSSIIFSGCIYFAFSLFVRPLQAEFGWERSTIMAAFTFLFLSLGLTSPFAGKAIDRYGPRATMAVGTSIVVFGFLALTKLSAPIHYYICYVIIGVGGAAMGPVASTAVVSCWFREKRGLAIGVMSTGIGFGGLLLAPLVGGFIIPRMGWRTGFIFISLLTATLIPLILWVIKAKSADEARRRETLNRNRPLQRAMGNRDGNEIDLKGALFSAAFCLIAAAFMMSQFSVNGTVQSQVPHLQDIGFPVTAASGALGLIGLVSAFSKLFFGWLCDRIKPKYAFAIGVFFMAMGTMILMMIGPASSLFILWCYAVVMGFGAGSWLPSMSMLVSTNFGMASYGAIFGAVTLAHNIGVSTGPLFAGYIYDITSGYHWAFIVFIFLYGCSIPSMLLLRRPLRLQ